MTKRELLALLADVDDEQYVGVEYHQQDTPIHQLCIQGVEHTRPWHGDGPDLVWLQVHARNADLSDKRTPEEREQNHERFREVFDRELRRQRAAWGPIRLRNTGDDE